ncbi:MAG: hypothetical protein MZU79_02735 [Anaerotruncus sp.]|nr:hypothetical protein [Anaerotruncus sp.]
MKKGFAFASMSPRRLHFRMRLGNADHDLDDGTDDHVGSFHVDGFFPRRQHRTPRPRRRRSRSRRTPPRRRRRQQRRPPRLCKAVGFDYDYDTLDYQLIWFDEFNSTTLRQAVHSQMDVPNRRRWLGKQ